MISMLFKRWRLRNVDRAQLVEINRLLMRAGRRCAYDLAHCSSEVFPDEQHWSGMPAGEYWHRKANMWQDIFNPGDDGKSYRDRLHLEISELEHEVETLKKKLAEHGIGYHNPVGKPF